MTTTTGAAASSGGARPSNGLRVAVKKEATVTATTTTTTTTTTASTANTPSASKDGTVSRSLSPDDTKPSPSDDSITTPGTSAAAATTAPPPKAAAAAAAARNNKKERRNTPPMFDHLPDATAEATSQFSVIADCLYGSKHMGSSDTDALDCDCAEELRDGHNYACGEDSDCINRATKMECMDSECKCGEACQNQRFQRKQFARVSVIKTEKKGFGLRTDADLQPNDFIYEYIGEVINEPAFRRRMLQYDKEGIKHFYFMSLTRSEFVDATRKGNLGRFCNHSCNPNCYVDKWVVGDKLRMGIFAGRHIRAGEELVFDYNVDRYGADPQPCYCGEPNCTGYIGGKTQTERATKLSQATIEALGIDDPDSWDTTVAKKQQQPTQQRKKKITEDDEAYVNRLEQTGLSEDGVTKVMAALMQCKEKWIAVKLLGRIQSARDDERVLNRVVRMHGYQILRSTLTAFADDSNVVLQVLDILYRFPRVTKNKISDSHIEQVVETFVASEHADVAAEAKRLLEEWGKLEIAYRIPRKKVDPNASAAASSSFDDRRGRDTPTTGGDEAAATTNSSNNSVRQRAPLSPLHGMVVPKGPRSNVPQRNQQQQQRKKVNNASGGGGGGGGMLPFGWFAANDPNGNVYYYTKSGATTWKRPTQPADKVAPAPKVPSKAQQDMDAVKDIIKNLTKPVPRPAVPAQQQAVHGHSHGHSHGHGHDHSPKPSRPAWQSLSLEKQQKIYANTIHPSIKPVIDRFSKRLPRDELKKLGKEISQRIVLSDYKHSRVEDPYKVSPKQEKKIKEHVRSFLEHAVEKYHKLASRPAQHGGAGEVDAAVEAEAEAEEKDAKEEAKENDTKDTSPDDRKRKRADSVSADAHAPPSVSSATPSEAPSIKRLKDTDAATAAGTSTPPTPPPPPPPPAVHDHNDQNDDADDNDDDDADTEVLRQKHQEAEQALYRENEEAMRDYEEQSKPTELPGPAEAQPSR